MDKKKGFTLIELIIAMGIGLMVMIIAYNVLFVGIKGHSSALKSFENQADIRYAIETTNNAIRYASVGFTVTEDDFKPIEKDGDVVGLVKPWNYIGLGPDKKSIVHYKYISKNKDKGYYEMEVLANGLDNITYDLKFTKPNNSIESKLIKYILEIKKDGQSEIITTEVEAINSLHVVDWGDAKKPAIALAYRTEETPEINKKPVAVVTMVLDVSGSMAKNMEGNNPTISKPSRLSILRDTLNDPNEGLFSIFSNSDVYVSLVPFSTNANMPHSNYNTKTIKNGASKFYNVNNVDDKDKLIKMVNDLSADGGTNTGDGLRRAYYQLMKFNEEKNSIYKLNTNQEIKNYLIVLVDGITTFGSRNVQITTGNFFTGNKYKINDFITDNSDLTNRYLQISGSTIQVGGGNISSGNYKIAIGKGSDLDNDHGKAYVDRIGNIIQSSKIVDQAFVIGYSSVKKDLASVADIAKALGIKVKENEEKNNFKDNEFVFIASDKGSLVEAFNNIGGYISEDLWQVEGPRLNP